MIIVNGDLLESPLRIIAHQVNCKGVIGGGIARQLRWKYSELFEEYQRHIKDCDNPLGSYYLFKAKNENKEILNIFGQDGFGRDKQYTDYQAVYIAFENYILDTKTLLENKNYSQMVIGIPYGFGCGLGGGNWNIMRSVLERIEREEDVVFIAYKLGD